MLTATLIAGDTGCQQHMFVLEKIETKLLFVLLSIFL